MTRRLVAFLLSVALVGCNEEAPPPPDRDEAVKGPSSSFGLFADQATALAAKESPPRIAVFPSQVDLTPEIPSITLLVRNDGLAALGLSNFGFDGDAAISSTTTCSAQQPLAPGATCQFALSYKPGAEPAFGRVFILPHAPAAPASIRVTGAPAMRMPSPPTLPPPVDNRGELEALRLLASSNAVNAGAIKVQPLPALLPPPPPAAVAVEEPFDDVYVPEIASPPRDQRRVLGNDRYIELTLLDPIITDNPGEVFAQVTWDVPGGRNPDKPNLPSETLIPAGSKLRGHYTPAKGKRAEIRWTWLKLPSGSVIELDDWRSYDAMGRAAVPGEMDHRYIERFGPGLMTTFLAAGAALAGRDTTNMVLGPLGTVSQTSTARSRAADRLSSGMSELAERVINDDEAIEKRLELAAGTTIVVKTEFDVFIPQPGQPLPPAYAAQARKRQENSKRDRSKRNSPPPAAAPAAQAPTPAERPAVAGPTEVAGGMNIPIVPYVFSNGSLYPGQYR